MGEGRFWIIVRDPGCVPERKGSYPRNLMAATIREFMRARPFSYLAVLTITDDGEPWIDDAPEKLQTLDGRSMSFAAKHNTRLRSTRRRAPTPAEGGE